MEAEEIERGIARRDQVDKLLHFDEYSLPTCECLRRQYVICEIVSAYYLEPMIKFYAGSNDQCKPRFVRSFKRAERFVSFDSVIVAFCDLQRLYPKRKLEIQKIIGKEFTSPEMRAYWEQELFR